jgi:hypothetical protein
LTHPNEKYDHLGGGTEGNDAEIYFSVVGGGEYCRAGSVEITPPDTCTQKHRVIVGAPSPVFAFEHATFRVGEPSWIPIYLLSLALAMWMALCSSSLPARRWLQNGRVNGTV